MAFILSEQLKYVTKSRVQRFRPSRFRELLPIDSSPPDWADTVEHSEITLDGEDPVRIGNGPVKNLPRPTIDKVAATISILHFGYAYGYTKREMTKASKQGLMLPATLAVANQTKVERFLDAVAAGERLTSLGLPGLLNIAAVSVYTASAKAAGGTAWTGATFDEIVADVANSIEKINEQTLENMDAALVILPPERYWLLARTLHSVSSVSALTLLQGMFPGVRFRSWKKLSLADAAGTGPRMVTMATGEDVSRIIIPSELTDDKPLDVPFGVEIPQSCSTAGVLTETPDAIAYTDGI